MTTVIPAACIVLALVPVGVFAAAVRDNVRQHREDTTT